MKKDKNEELQSRREFFKSAAKAALPVIGFAVLGPSVLSSCDTEEPDNGGSSSGGSKRCGGLCTMNCRNECEGNAAWAPVTCNGNCKGACFRTCKTSCYRTNKSY